MRRRHGGGPGLTSTCLVVVLLQVVVVDATSYVDGIFRESLRANRVQACNGERITLSCPRNTQILVQTGFYGRVVPESQLCPGRRPSIGNPPAAYHSTCDVIQAHTRISELCDKRRKCTVVVDSHTFDDDPCPATSKYLQMSYFCMPVSFDEETFCDSSEMRLECREGRRLAVYSAVVENSARRQPSQCSPTSPSIQSVNECSDDVLPQVLRECHARGACSLHVSPDFLGSTCVAAHLHIVYMCVNEEIFSEEAIKGELLSLEKYLKESDAVKKHEKRRDDVTVGKKQDAKIIEPIIEANRAEIDVVEHVETSSLHNPFSNDASYVTHDEYSMREESHEEPVQANAVGIGHDVVQVFRFFRMNKEKVAACVVLSISLAAIVVLSACIARYLCSREPPNKSSFSAERNRLVNTHVHSTSPMLHMCDIEDESFLRYSLATPSKSHYDF